jgi:hypothetical protein
MAFPTFKFVKPSTAKPTHVGEATRRKAMFKNFKLILIVMVVVVLAASAYAFADANTVPATKAGSGAGEISGYTVSSVAYTLNSSNPSQLDAVSFTLDAAAETVKVKLVAAGSTWFDCTNSQDNDWSCNTSGASVEAMDELTVVASGN